MRCDIYILKKVCKKYAEGILFLFLLLLRGSWYPIKIDMIDSLCEEERLGLDKSLHRVRGGHHQKTEKWGNSPFLLKFTRHSVAQFICVMSHFTPCYSYSYSRPCPLRTFQARWITDNPNHLWLYQPSGTSLRVKITKRHLPDFNQKKSPLVANVKHAIPDPLIK